MSTQDPNRQIGFLQQCLSSDKKPLGFFLGAGCPVAIKIGPDRDASLIPDIAGLTKVIREEMLATDDYRPLFNLIEEHFRVDGHGEFTVEDVLTHIRALRSVVGNGEVRGFSSLQLEYLDDHICQLIHRVMDRSLPESFDTPYHKVAEWVNAVRRDNPVEFFTTNYDLLLEEAFEEFHVPYFDGFAGARNPFFDLRSIEEDSLPKRWVRLWKLHGSINWYQIANKGVYRGKTESSVGVKRVIHPSHLKYQESRRMPYLAMMDRLRAFLKQPTAVLILCGYSFRDEHINDVIIRELQATQTAIAFGLCFGELEKYPQAATLASKCSNLNILARDGGVIGGQESKWTERNTPTQPEKTDAWIHWEPANPREGNGIYATKVSLGDFEIFGKFLHELVGDVRVLQGSHNA